MILNMGTGASKLEQEKTVTAGTSAVTVTPDSNSHVLSKVTVNPTPSQSKTITPGPSQKTVTPDSGKLLSSVVVNGDSELIPANIRGGIEIFGVTGTLVSSNIVEKSGTYTVSGYYGDYSSTLSIPHGLGVTPKYAGFTNMKLDTEYNEATLYGFTTDATNITVKFLTARPESISWFAVSV